MNLYISENNKLKQIDKDTFDLEKDIQSLVETNLETIFNLEFVSSEFIINEFRIDTLAYDNENNCFVIIEYKKGSSYSVIDQGYSYMSTMLNNKSDFILEYIEKTNNTLKKTDIDWSQSRIIFVSPSFNSYQKNSVNFKDVPFELWEIKKFEKNIVSLNHLTPTSKESINKIQKNKSSIISNVGREVKVYDEKDHTSKTNEKVANHWEKLKERLLELEGVKFVFRKNHVSLFIDSRVITYYNFNKSSIRIDIVRGSVYLDGSKSKKFFTLDDPKKVAGDYSKKMHSGYTEMGYTIKFDEKIDLDYLMFLINQKYNDL